MKRRLSEFLPRCLNRLRKEIIFTRLGRPTRVLSGPFKGMRYIFRNVGSALHPKILGVYEKELSASIERLLDLPCDRLVNIGSAEGYYAIGFARRHACPDIVCVDRKPEAHRYAQSLAKLNGVESRLRYLTSIEVQDFEALLEDAAHPLLIVDCEGYEFQLLDPVRAPVLNRCRMLVEMHPYNGLGDLDEFLSRFESSHHVEVIRAEPRIGRDSPAGVKLSDRQAAILMNEGRPPGMTWLMMTPLGDGCSSGPGDATSRMAPQYCEEFTASLAPSGA